jgi:hypothetical protein
LAQRLGFPLQVIHRWFGRLPASLVYLRDLRSLMFLAGIQSVAPDLRGTQRELRRLAASLGAERILCFGNSGGIAPALRYGLDMRAEAVLGMAGPILADPNRYKHPRAGALWSRMAEELPRDAFHPDLPFRYSVAEWPPRVLIAYGADNEDDCHNAHAMAHLPCVTLYKVEGYGRHNIITELVIRGAFDPLLEWLVSGSQGEEFCNSAAEVR